MNSRILAALAVATFAVSACSKGGESTQSAPAAKPATETAAAPAAAPAGPKTTLTATVNFTGTAPARAKLKREADAFCSKNMLSEEVIVTNGKLQNVVVRVIKGAESHAVEVPATPVVIDQQDCMYRPRVIAAVAGQTITVKSSDATGHNVHTFKGDETIFNRAMNAPGSFDKSTKEFGVDNGLITFKCDIHPWMTGFAVVNANPYFGVTAEDGTAKIELPAGKYTIEAWHEKYGVKTADVTIEEGKPATIGFDYSGAETM